MGFAVSRRPFTEGSSSFSQRKLGRMHPNFLPAMKRAQAFVTNEGGFLSHAAIVARELKKPCIVGTRIATQVLNDGDVVEVDANKGIVKVIK